MARSDCGLVKNCSGVVLLDDAPVGHEHDAVGGGAREAHLVGDHDHRHAALGEVDHDVEDLLDHLGVEGGGGLVEEHHLGLHRERAGDGDPLLLAAGELGGVLAGLVADPDPVEQLLRARLGVGLLDPADLDRPERDVLEDRLVREEVEALEDHPDLGAQPGERLALLPAAAGRRG